MAAIAGVQGGKTTVGAAWMLDQVSRYPKDDHLILAPTYKILQQSTLKKFFTYYPKEWGDYNKQDYVFHLKTGGDIFVRSSEDPDSLEGMTLRSAWLDEAGQMKPVVWQKMKERTAIKQGRVLITTTPYNMGWLYELIKTVDKRFKMFKWKSVQNAYFPEEEYNYAKANMRPEMFEMRYGGEFRKLAGLVYPEFNETCIVPSMPVQGDWKLWCGIDFGYTNPSVCLFMARTPDNTYIVCDEIYQSEMLIHQFAKRIRSRGVNVHLFFGDPSGKQEIMELGNYGVFVNPAENDVPFGIQKVEGFLRQGRLKVMAHCVKTIDEFKQYHYKESNDPNKIAEEPEKEYDHAMDALRYALVSERTEPIIRPPVIRYPPNSMGALLKRIHRKMPRNRMSTFFYP